MVLLNIMHAPAQPPSAPVLSLHPVVTPPESKVNAEEPTAHDDRQEAIVPDHDARPASESALLSPTTSAGAPHLVPCPPTSPRLVPPLNLNARRPSLPNSLEPPRSNPGMSPRARRASLGSARRASIDSAASGVSGISAASSARSCASARSTPGPGDYEPSLSPRFPVPSWSLHSPERRRHSWFEEQAARSSSPGPARYGSRSSLALSDGTAFSASRTDRFPDPARTPGPGEYEAIQRPSSTASSNLASAWSLQTSAQRPDYNSPVPGPGEYRPTERRASTPGRFSTARFVRQIHNKPLQSAEDPGPGAYTSKGDASPRSGNWTFASKATRREARYISPAHSRELELTHSPGHVYTPREPQRPRTRNGCTWGGSPRFAEGTTAALDSALIAPKSLY
eukprot:tig00020944_g16388.t1